MAGSLLGLLYLAATSFSYLRVQTNSCRQPSFLPPTILQSSPIFLPSSNPVASNPSLVETLDSAHVEDAVEAFEDLSPAYLRGGMRALCAGIKTRACNWIALLCSGLDSN